MDRKAQVVQLQQQLAKSDVSLARAEQELAEARAHAEQGFAAARVRAEQELAASQEKTALTDCRRSIRSSCCCRLIDF